MEAQMLILFLLISHLKRLLTSALIRFLKIWKQQKVYQEYNLRSFYLLLHKNRKKQVDGVAMGSPLGPTQANAFLVQFEKIWLQNCPSDFKPHYYRRYVDDVFVLFTSPKHLLVFRNFINGQHANMSFTIERERQNRISFLDIAIIREHKTFIASVCRKPSFGEVYTHFDNFFNICL